MNQPNIDISEERVKRPFGVWFLTIWDALFAGLFPFALTIFVLVRGGGSVTLVQVLPALILAPAVIIAAIGA